MNFIKVNYKETVKEKRYKRGYVQDLIIAFSKSGIKLARIEDSKHANASSCTSSITISARNLGMPHIRGMIISNVPYIVNDAIEEE